jgi:hypothetical protein
MWRDAVGVAVSIGSHFGATPSDMARLGLAQVKGLSLTQELRERKAQKDA